MMAMAGELTIVQAQHVCDLGQLSANEIVTPGIFVDRVLHVAPATRGCRAEGSGSAR